jgi:hypothetical protein
VELTSNHIHFFISYVTAFLIFSLIARWYVWPAVKDRDPKTTLSPLLLYACLRVNGLMFLPMVWVFNIVGLLDLVYANISTFKDQVDPVQLGASYYLAVMNVPAMVIVHLMIFFYLLRRHGARDVREPVSRESILGQSI